MYTYADMHDKSTFAALTLVLVGAAFALGIAIGEERVPPVALIAGVLHKDGDALTESANKREVDFMPYWRTWNILETKFVPFGTSTAEEISQEKRVEKSIEGLVASYHDPYTVFFPPKEAEAFKTLAKGSLEGIGAVVGDRDGKLYVVAPLKDSPAEKAGLLSGDRITSIDGATTDGLSVDVAVEKIRGEKGTEVVLHIEREGSEPSDVKVVRGTIEIPSTANAVVQRDVPKPVVVTLGPDGVPLPAGPVETEKKDFFVLQLVSFSQTSVASFKRELEKFVESGSDTLIIDLRGNPGGYLDAAVDMASWFLPEGAVVVREYAGPNKTESVHVSRGYDLLKGRQPKMAILVNQGTASAAEILAGALREHGMAVLVGEHTFGKGSVQELISITDKLSLKVTVARWYTPNGLSISNGGLIPDRVVDLSIASASSTDPYLDAAIDVLTSGTSTSVSKE